MGSQCYDGALPLLTGATAAPTTGSTVTATRVGGVKSFQASVTGTGAVSATVIIDVSLDGTNWIPLTNGTISLSGTTSATTGFVLDAGWMHFRARCTAISGTSTTVTAFIGG